MTTMTRYPHGVPSWLDLATPDPAASKAFYAELFGWDYTDDPTDRPGVVYTMARKDGRTVAGMMLLSEEMAAAGMPPVWSTYVTVTDLEAIAARVEPAGGRLLQPPMEVMDSGRMAVLSDPAGAVISMWEAKNHIGAEVVNEHGALTWNELITPDPAAVTGFYGEVFGWTSETAPMPSGDYTVFHVEGGDPQGIAGAMALPEPGMPAFWGVYFHVDDATATAARAAELGATTLMEATAMEGVGTMAALTDPQGAAFSIMTPEG
jgi:predicted enzyme related to lactoylglutathione lyase